MKTWFSAAELLAMALPGLPETLRSLYRLAAREGWNQRPGLARLRQGRGGGWEYRVECLPLPARMAWLARQQGDPADTPIPVPALLLPPAGATLPLPGAARQARDARLEILGLFQTWRRHAGLDTTRMLRGFVDHYNAGQLAVPEPVRAAIPRLSASTVRRWVQALAAGAVDRLAVDRGAARRGKGIMDEAEDGALKLKILALHAQQPHLTADHIRTLCRDAFGNTILYRGTPVPMPSVRAFQMVLKRLRTTHRAELLALQNPDAFKNRMRVSGSRAHLVTRLNALWQIDASPADLLCVDGRYTIYVCIDVFSRRIITTVSRTPRAAALGLLLKKALLAWGVPERIQTDHGSDFVARATRRLLAGLAIEIDLAAPFSPEQKGVVERAIGTIQRDLMPTLPGFIGHSVAERKAIEARRTFAARLGQDDARTFRVELTAADLGQALDRWCEDRYAHRPHAGLGKMTPFQKAASCPHPLRRIDSEAALAVLLAPVAGKDGLRQVGKQGIRIEGAHYLAAGLMPGETVLVRMDPLDLGRVFVFAEDGETFRALAVCPELAGVDPAAAILAAQAAQKAFLAQRLGPIRKEATRIKPREMAAALARQAARDAGTLAAFPQRSTRHVTPALAGGAETEAALAILRREAAPEPRQANHAERAMLARLEAEAGKSRSPDCDQSQEAVWSRAPVLSPSRVVPLHGAATAHQRFRQALALEARLAAGESLATDEALWLGSFRQTADYRGLKAVHDEFGEEGLRMA
jgi:putative transposase